MAFKFPLPVPKKRKKEPEKDIESSLIPGLEDFRKSEFTSCELIGKGSYGKIYKVKRQTKAFIIKELASDDASDIEKDLFIKEGKLMASVKGHPNILDIYGYSSFDNSLLLEFISFSFALLKLDNDAVSNLKGLLTTCDRLNDFQGFEHLQYHLASDILSGLDFLHGKGIVHRDLKPDNILVSNQHYATCESEDLQYWWLNKPVVAKLADFGESRSLLVQTKSLCKTSTTNLVRGSPVYMAPEAILENSTNASIDDLKQMDIWSVGMVVFHLLNPDAKYPYAKELNEMKFNSPMEVIKGLIKEKKRPESLTKYTNNQNNIWKGISEVCFSCLNFNPAKRPSCRELLSALVRKHVCVSSLLVSQGSFAEAVDARLADCFVTIPNETLNACSFLALRVGERVLCGQTDLSQIAQAAILDFPENINKFRCQEQLYSVDEAYTILTKCNEISECEFDVVIPSLGAVPYEKALDGLIKELSCLRDRSEAMPFAAIYTAPPYTLLVCKTSMGCVSVVDTHPLPTTFGGTGTAAIITPLPDDASLRALCCWLLHRTGKGKSRVVHELTVLTKIQVKSPTEIGHEGSDDAMDVDPISSEGMACTSDPSTSETLSEEDENAVCILEERKKTRYRNVELNPRHWEDCDPEVTQSIPFDVDGKHVYAINCLEGDMMKVSKDGRPWNTWSTSSRQNFNGKRRVARCKGSAICNAKTCPYRQQYGTENRLQFERKDSTMICFTCGGVAEQLQCPASKVWEYFDGKVTVMYTGDHTCIARPPKVSKDIIYKELLNNPGSKPSKLVNDRLASIMTSADFEWQSVEKMAEDFVDLKRIHNARQQLKSLENPDGENFEALGLYKQKCNEKDPYFIFKVNNKALNGENSYVFKSSISMAKLALDMDRDKSSPLSKEYAHIDAKHDRCRGFKTLTLWAYHPVFRKTLSLAKMEVEQESTANIVMFWRIFNEMLQQVSNNPAYVFNPTGIMADENHANWKSIQQVFGNEYISRTVSCEFHYKQSVLRQARKLESDSDAYVKQAHSLLEALTPSEFDAACVSLQELIRAHPDLNHWYRWWYDRRTHIFRAFKATDAPNANLAEVGHSKMASVGRTKMSLLEAARQDVASAIRQDAELRLFKKGLSKGGKGTNSNQRRAKLHTNEMKRASSYAKELDVTANMVADPTPVFVPVKGKHRPPKQKQKTIVSRPSSNLNTTTSNPNINEAPTVSNIPAQKGEESEGSRLAFRVTLHEKILNLKSCYGCGRNFAEKHKKPPNNLILQSFMKRTYRNKNGKEVKTKKAQATYFHLNLNCVRKVEPFAELKSILINDTIRQCLTPRHACILRKFGIEV